MRTRCAASPYRRGIARLRIMCSCAVRGARFHDAKKKEHTRVWRWCASAFFRRTCAHKRFVYAQHMRARIQFKFVCLTRKQPKADIPTNLVFSATRRIQHARMCVCVLRRAVLCRDSPGIARAQRRTECIHIRIINTNNVLPCGRHREHQRNTYIRDGNKPLEESSGRSACVCVCRCSNIV